MQEQRKTTTTGASARNSHLLPKICLPFAKASRPRPAIWNEHVEEWTLLRYRSLVGITTGFDDGLAANKTSPASFRPPNPAMGYGLF